MDTLYTVSNVYLFLRKSVLEKHHFFERGGGRLMFAIGESSNFATLNRKMQGCRSFRRDSANLKRWNWNGIRDRFGIKANFSLSLSQERVKIKKKWGKLNGDGVVCGCKVPYSSNVPTDQWITRFKEHPRSDAWYCMGIYVYRSIYRNWISPRGE